MAQTPGLALPRTQAGLPPLRANIVETLLDALITEQGEKEISNLKNDKVVASSSSAALPPGGRREPELSEGDRSATGGNAAAYPDPEVAAQTQRRRFTAEYKQRILAETDHAKGSGSIGALLRREGLYSSLLATWRREREAGVRQALSPQKRGPESKRDPVAEENQQLRRETQRLTEELRKAEIVIDIQKKWLCC
jgi:transposase